MYNAIDGSGILDAILVNGSGIGLNSDDTNLPWAARLEFVICAGGELLCIYIFGCNKRRSIKEYIFTWFINGSFAHMEVLILLVTLMRILCVGVYFA